MSQIQVTQRQFRTPQAAPIDPAQRGSLPEPRWQGLFPELTAGDAASRALMDTAYPLSLAAGQALFRAGSPCERYVLVLAGSVRVQATCEEGREAVLYQVSPGQSCVLTTCCLLADDLYPAEGFAESQVQALSVSKTDFARALESAPAFRRFAFASLGNRIAEVTSRMEEVACRPMERRLATYLLARIGWGCAFSATHQEIAADVRTARAIVSRHLKRFKANGLVRLGPASVEVCNPDGLRRLIDRPF
jgi:CRP/FNR family transcriptional regulator, anaerobic regulatory protein